MRMPFRQSARHAAGRVRDYLVAPVLEGQERLALAIGRSEARRVRAMPVSDIRDAEFRVFSQWGEDGIIQYLLGRVPVDLEVFVEFGVEDYRESNTRFLLENDGWRGLIIDGGVDHILFLRRRAAIWRTSIDAVSAFLTRETVDSVIADAGVTGDIGLLSVDVDGNDYWLLESVRGISPRIIVIEYNSLFGAAAAVSVPYRPDFQRILAHHSNLYYGASLAALSYLCTGRGYRLVGCNRAGVNAFFVRDDVAGGLPSLTPAEAFVQRRHRESRDRAGRLTYIGDIARQLDMIRHLDVIEVTTGRTCEIGEIVS